MPNNSPIQLVIDLPEIQEYFHADTSPERIPLLLVCDHPVCATDPLSKFGFDVEIAAKPPESERPFFEITAVEQLESSLIIRFNYLVEGLVGSVELINVDNEWRVSKQRISET